MFPEKTVEEIEETTSADCIMTPKSSMAFFLEGLQDDDRASDFSQVEKKKIMECSLKILPHRFRVEAGNGKTFKNCLRSAQR